ncbi:hypothetical protein QEN19_002417 [Hanseniaspora menglaensis]
MSLPAKYLKDCQIKLGHTLTPVTMPQYGFGTASPMDQLEITKESVKVAIKEAGVRHIDTARFYGYGKIEYIIGEAIQELIAEKVITREELFITTKVWPTYWDKAKESLDISLKALQIDYVDLLLQHWPFCYPKIVNPETGEWYGNPKDPKTGKVLYETEGDFFTTYRQIDAIYNDPSNKSVKAIGVSNFNVQQLEKIFNDDTIKTKPSVLQVELNPQLTQVELYDYCNSHGIVLTGYSPLGSTGAPILKLPEIQEIAKFHKITPYDVVISWFMIKKLVVIPRSLNPKRIATMKYYYDLPSEDIAKIDNIGVTKPFRHIDEDFAAILPGFTGRTKTTAD